MYVWLKQTVFTFPLRGRGTRRVDRVKYVLSYVAVGVLLALLGGCSATSLRCGVDADSSFVELYNVPQNFSQNVRSYGELCGFAYEGGE